MIGVYCQEDERKIAREFFELFKTPWEFFKSTSTYEVILSTSPDLPEANTGLMVIYSSSSTQFDTLREIKIRPVDCRYLMGNKISFPIYGNLASLRGKGAILIKTVPNSDVVAIKCIASPTKVIRVGFDLFSEIGDLLNLGQPSEKASSPTLEAHIALLRDWILSAGIPLVEIPPIPFGYNFFACLTHDIDFAGLRRHKFAHTIWGFIYRALVGSLIRFIQGRISFAKLIRNWIATTKLPLIFMGLADDFWEHFDRYAEIDTTSSSTYFLIPFKNRHGDNLKRDDVQKRAVAYDIGDVSKQVEYLMSKGCEIGLHGIDAWHCSEKGLQELQRINAITGPQQTGVRIHWLCYDKQSPLLLERSGFDYDASLGFNETIGFRNGTTQVFRPSGVNRLLEIPLNIQDTALFFPRRLNLSEENARQLCRGILDVVSNCGGVLTISWHERSLEPERLWGDFYLWLLDDLHRRGAWVGGARQVVHWFRRRRSVNFEGFRIEGEKIHLKISGDNLASGPQMFLRFYLPSHPRKSIVDVPWDGESDVEIPTG